MVVPYLPAGQGPLQVLLVAPTEVLKYPGGHAVHVAAPGTTGLVITWVQKQGVFTTPLPPHVKSPGIEDLKDPVVEQYPEAV